MQLKRIWKLFLRVIFLLLINTASVKAQGLPCGDPDVDCPIDAPVIIFAMLMLFLSVKKLRSAAGKAVTEPENG